MNIKVLIAFALVLFAIVSVSASGKKGNRPRRPNHLKKSEIDAIKENCKKDKKACKGQSEESKVQRALTKQMLIQQKLAVKKGISNADAEKEVEEYLTKMNLMTKKFYELNGMAEIEPADVGIYEGDILLSDQQLDEMISNMNNELAASGRSKRAAGTNFSTRSYAKWSMPIHYYIDPAFTSTEVASLKKAIDTLTTSVGCLSFVQDSAVKQEGPQMYYIKNSGSGCGGSSYVGKLMNGCNPINFQSGGCDAVWQVAIPIHETIHALGGGHEQSRIDRDDHITIVFANINPDSAFNYNIYSGSSTYGIPYNYKSRMHYFQGSFNNGQNYTTMVPKIDTTLGSTSLSTDDINQLKLMYCDGATLPPTTATTEASITTNVPETCSDYYINCYEFLEECDPDHPGYEAMINDCPATCGKC